jgi:demethylspheroidene O-methyltransferase
VSDALKDPVLSTSTSLVARWVERALGWRDALLASERFQAFAARFPLTRRVSARKAKACFDLCAGFVYSQVLFACVKLDLFERLARRSQTVEELAAATGLRPERMGRLLLAAASLDLVERRAGGRYGLGMLGAAMRANPGVRAMIEHHAMFYADMADPVALLRGEGAPTRLSRYWPYADGETGDGSSRKALGVQDVAAYTDLMAASQQLVARDILDAVDLKGVRRILDVGGGDGSFLRAVHDRAPGLNLALFDLPAVVEQARSRFAAAGLEDKVALHGGDFHADALPAGADLISLVRIAHDHDDVAVAGLLARAFAALPPGGRLLIGEPMAGSRETGRMADAYFGFYLLAMGTGRARRPDELIAMLTAAGFTEARVLATPRPLLTGVITARKPA